MLECSTSMPFNWASKDSVFSVHFIVALLDFESREYMYYYYIVLGYCRETIEHDQWGRYRSGWVKRGKGGRGNKKDRYHLPDQWKVWSPVTCCTSDQGIQVWALVKVASPADVWRGLSWVPALWTPKNICGGGYSWGHCIVFLGRVSLHVGV